MQSDSRLNLKLPNQIKDYLKEMSWRNRTSITGYLIKLVEEDMKKNMDVVLMITGKKE